MGDQLRSATSLYETLARVLTLTGVLAALLAAVGVYGLIAYQVQEATHEIGIRTAVGATRALILRKVMARGLTPALIGVIVGVVVSLAVAPVMPHLLFDVAATDAAALAGATVFVLATAVLACLVPAWRGSRVDPAVALRHQT